MGDGSIPRVGLVKRDDLVTVIYQRGLMLTRVSKTPEDGWSFLGDGAIQVGTNADGYSVVQIADRGITWIPGWHPSTSRKGAALLTAYALSR